MTKKLEFEVTFNNSVSPEPKNELAYIEGFKSLEGLGKVTIELYGKSKTNPMNRYFWGVAVPHFIKAIRSKGHSRSDDWIIHDMKMEFFSKTEYVDGKKRTMPLSLKNSMWGTKDFNERLERMIHWCVEYCDYQIPLPNEKDYNE